MNTVKTIGLSLLASWSLSMSQAQWAVYSNEKVFSDSLYSVRGDKHFEMATGMYFPSYVEFPTLRNGYYIIDERTPEKVKQIRSRSFLIHAFSEPLRLKKDTTAIFFRLYLDNISSYTLNYLSTEGKTLYEYHRRVQQQKYQVPVFSPPISAWTVESKRDLLRGPDGRDALFITVEPVDSTKPVVALLGDFLVGDRVTDNREIYHPFIESLLGLVNEKRENPEAHINTPIEAAEFIRALPTDDSLGVPLNLYLRANDQTGPGGGTSMASADELTVFRQLIGETIKCYPFYDERKLDREQVLRDYQAFLTGNRDINDLAALAQRTSDFINKTFDDPHFKIRMDPIQGGQPETSSRKVSPVRLYEINHSIRVASVFDSSYRLTLPLDAEVVKVDNRPAGPLIDSLSQPFKDRPYYLTYRKNIIARLLERSKTDSAAISILQGGSMKTVMLRYNGEIVIPSSFIPAHCQYKTYNDSVGYFRINAWFDDVYTLLLNHWESIEQLRTLIIDLRGNGGGNKFDVIRTLSLFIRQPTLFYTYRYSTGGSDSCVIVPNGTRSYQGKVIILGDAETACASEMFITAMRKRGNVKLISTEPTMGATAERFDFHFPSKITVSIDCITPKAIFPNGAFECSGLKPDLLVKYTSVYDLRPYNDLLREKAIRDN